MKQLERGSLKTTETRQNGMNEAGELGMKGLKTSSESGGENKKSEEKKRHMAASRQRLLFTGPLKLRS